jgi:hypothetical protein
MSLRRKKTLKESASDFAESILPALETAVDTAKELAADARDKAAPVISDARDKAAPVVAAGAAVAAEKAAAGTTLVAEKAAEGRDALAERTEEHRKAAKKAAKQAAKNGRKKAEAARQAAGERAEVQRERAAVKIAAFQDASSGNKVSAFKDAEPKKGGKFKKFLLLSALAGVGALVFKKLKGDDEAAHWQKSYTPTPAPSTTSNPVGSGGLSAAAADAAGTDAGAPTPDAHDDLGAASPDEALADSVEQPHEDTTPDQPLEVVEIDTENK